MKSVTTMKTLPLLLAGLAAFNTRAGTLDPELGAAISDKQPGEKLDVIIRCIDPLDPSRIPERALVSALRYKANACETSLADAFNDPSASPRTLWIINGIAATVSVAQLDDLANRADVDTIYLNKKVGLPPAPVSTGAGGSPPLTFWNISEVRADDLWALGHYGTGVVVATMDTGVDSSHADIGPNWRGGSNSWYDPNEQHTRPFDSNGHGTGVMGLILGGNAGGFDIGVAPDARWIAVKIFDDSNKSSYEKIHLGFQWLLDPNGDQDPIDAPDIVNNSWVLQGTEDQCLGEFTDDIAALKAAGIAVVFSGGNFGPNHHSSMDPANDPKSLSVGAVDSLLDVTSFSSRGPSACDGGFYPKIAAPGKDILTAGLTTGGSNPTNYAFGTGTSYAAPHVVGAIALLKSAVPGATLSEIETAIRDGAFDLGISGPDNDTGAGMLDLVEAFYLLDGSGPPPPAGVQLYFSTESDTALPGVTGPYDNADIYHWDANGFSRVLDASAAGLPNYANVDALVVDGSVYYLSFRRNGGTKVPGLGIVDDEDIVKYEAGAWSLYFDGGAVGLADTNGEDVDGFALLVNGDILVSVAANARVPGLGGVHRDEDLLRCRPTAVPVTDCSWNVYFDGSDVALNNSAAEDIDGVSVSSDGNIQLSTVGAFNVAGLSGNDEDVLVCTSPTTGTNTTCSSFTLLFDGDAEGILDDLDAIDLP